MKKLEATERYLGKELLFETAHLFREKGEGMTGLYLVKTEKEAKGAGWKTENIDSFTEGAETYYIL